jgi:DNA-damage-inducible protein J
MPFNPLIPNAETIKAMKEAENGPLPRFGSVEELLEDLHAGD